MTEVEDDKPLPRWRRFAAALIDTAVLVALEASTLLAMARLRIDQPWAAELAILGVLTLHEVALPWASGGRSVGRSVFRLRLVRETDFGPPSFLQCAARLATRVLLFCGFVVFVSYEPDVIGVVLLLGVESAMASLTPKRQSVADVVARTFVASGKKVLSGSA